jgi:solute carrier family 25 phosphate transporter 23/24/25/41
LSLAEVWRKIYSNEGVVGYFKGNAVNIVRIVPFSAVEFFTFEVVKSLMFEPGEQRDKIKLLYCGFASGIAASTATYPLDIIRTKLSVNTEMASRSIGSMALEMIKTEGALSLYKGWFATLMGIAPYVGLKMSCFDILKPFVIPDSNSPFFSTSNMLLGAAAGTFAATLTYPTDLIKRKLQLRTPETPYRTVMG